MKFNISSKTLLSHLSTVSKVVNSKNTISILNNFLFELKDGMLVITGSDQETTLTSRVALIAAEGEGKFAVNVKCLLDMLKELPEQPLEFNINDSNLEIVINYMNGKFNFVGIDGNEFPQKSELDADAKTFTLPAKEVSEGISHTIFAVGADELRAVMMGVNWDITPDNIVFVASDTHMLVRYTNNRIKSGVQTSFIMPTKPAKILSDIMSKVEGEVNVVADSKCATFSTETYTLTCRFINGRYPNYNTVIPQNNPYTLSVDRISLLNAVRRVSIFAPNGLVKFDLNENNIRLTSEDMDFATSADETVNCNYSGEHMVIGFNNVRSIDVLNNLDSDTVQVQMSSPVRAVVFVPDVQNEGEEQLILLMPFTF